MNTTLKNTRRLPALTLAAAMTLAMLGSVDRLAVDHTAKTAATLGVKASAASPQRGPDRALAFNPPGR